VLLHSSLAGVGIVLLLASVFRTRRNLLLVLADLPFALVGGLMTSTLLNLLLLSTLSLLWGRFPTTTPGEPLIQA